MQRKRERNGLTPTRRHDLAAAAGDGDPRRHHFTQLDQVNLLVAAREADPDMGFMARLMALCSLPRTNPGNRKEYSRGATARGRPGDVGGRTYSKLPYGALAALAPVLGHDRGGPDAAAASCIWGPQLGRLYEATRIA